MANYSLMMMLVVMASINIGLGLYDLSIQEYNPDFVSTIDYSSTPTSTLLYGGLNGSLNIDSSLAIPQSSDSVDPDTGNIFTDAWKSVSNWFNRVDSSIGIVTGALDQPRGFLLDIGVPRIFANAFGILWYLIMIILFVSFIKGGGAD